MPSPLAEIESPGLCISFACSKMKYLLSEWMDGWIGGWMDAWMDQIHPCVSLNPSCSLDPLSY